MGVTAENSKPKRIIPWWSSHEPFVAKDHFPSGFRIVWDVPPTCGKCGAAIEAGDKVVWTGKLPPSDPKQLCHVECAGKGGSACGGKQKENVERAAT